MIISFLMEDSFDILVIGGASVDVFMFPEKYEIQETNGLMCFKYGSKIAVDYMHQNIGGGGANTAVGLSRHGLKTVLITKVGKDAHGELILKKLQEEGVDIKQIKLGSLNSGYSTIIQGEYRDRVILTYRGTNSEISTDDIDNNLLKETRNILINALYERTSDILNEIVSKAHEFQLNIFMTLGENEIYHLGKLLFNITNSIHTLFVNEDESKALYHVLTNNIHEKQEQCEACKIKTNDILTFFRNSGIKNIAITLGPSGVKFIDESNKIYTIAAKSADIINTTGLGDAFCSGYLAYFLKGKSIEESLTHGIENSTSVMSFVGAQTGLLKT